MIATPNKALSLTEPTQAYLEVRNYTEELCKPLAIEDYVPQPMEDVSPPKWHLGHTTWFFETFILEKFYPNYQHFNADFGFLFNSYYNHAGSRVLRKNRGILTRPLVEEVYAYRKYVDEKMQQLLQNNSSATLLELLEIGLNHEQQHQELLVYDIKFILGTQPLQPKYSDETRIEVNAIEAAEEWINISSGLYEVGAENKGFSFDNERPRHQVYLEETALRKTLVSNAEYLNFIEDGGYNNFRFWLDEGWHFVQYNQLQAPLYWTKKSGVWHEYQLSGIKPLNPDAPVSHLSYFEAYAYAAWAGHRLPTEFEWEVTAERLHKGQLWEWTASAYTAYPGFKIAPGALGEYNGKFMINQQVLRGSSVATPSGHERKTYRNFFNPKARWIFSGIRLAKTLD